MSVNLSNVLKIIACLLIIKICYFIFSFLVVPKTEISIDFYIKGIKKNDSDWYEKIAENGYPDVSDKRDLGYVEGANIKQSEWAFFPCYPYVNKGVSQFLNVNFNIAGIITSVAFSITGGFK